MLTTLVIFIPITLWTFIVCFGKGGMPRHVCWWNIGIGLFYHIVMFGSIMPQVFSGNINMPLLTVIMGIDMVITFILWLALHMAHISTPQKRFYGAFCTCISAYSATFRTYFIAISDVFRIFAAENK